MTQQTLTLAIPDYIYEQLRNQAQATGRSLADFASQLLTQTLPPPVEDDLPPAIQAELQAMTHLSDDALWQIARGRMNEDKVALYDVLLERNQEGELTSQGRELLDGLREEADALMLRKAHAYTLLKSRGHRLPTLEELRNQTP